MTRSESTFCPSIVKVAPPPQPEVSLRFVGNSNSGLLSLTSTSDSSSHTRIIITSLIPGDDPLRVQKSEDKEIQLGRSAQDGDQFPEIDIDRELSFHGHVNGGHRPALVRKAIADYIRRDTLYIRYIDRFLHVPGFFTH